MITIAKVVRAGQVRVYYPDGSWSYWASLERLRDWASRESHKDRELRAAIRDILASDPRLEQEHVGKVYEARVTRIA